MLNFPPEVIWWTLIDADENKTHKRQMHETAVDNDDLML